MSFAHYDLLLDVIRREHDRTRQQPAYLRIVRREPRVRPSHGRPRSLPRGRPAGPTEAA